MDVSVGGGDSGLASTAGMLDGAPEDSRWAGLFLRAPRLAPPPGGFGPSPHVQTEMKGPAEIAGARQVPPP